MVQSFNWAGVSSLGTLLLRPSLLIPHLTVPDVSHINFYALRNAGIRALVFDKDNTLTAPYVDHVHSSLEKSWSKCKKSMGKENLVVVSNSAGTEDDPGYAKAKLVEEALGVPVLRHREKKPAGGQDAIDHFKVSPSSIGVVGDRILTDVVYGNMSGMFTIHVTKIITKQNDNKAAALVCHLLLNTNCRISNSY
ncbi:mitochondrial PGP phosphatase [Phlyctochytrium arcticum]|nr:mitochondrial PGP phosphatase [Phlyctochytrium arcticum]